MKPSLCRLVIYKFTDDPDDPKDELNGVEVAAIVTAVRGTSVCLTTFPPGADPTPLLDDNEDASWIPFSETIKAGCWTWPPKI